MRRKKKGKKLKSKTSFSQDLIHENAGDDGSHFVTERERGRIEELVFESFCRQRSTRRIDNKNLLNKIMKKGRPALGFVERFGNTFSSSEIHCSKSRRAIGRKLIDKFEKRNTERPNIGGIRVRLKANHFGADPERRTNDINNFVLQDKFAKTKIDQFNVSFVRKHNIFRFKIAMNHVMRVQIVESLENIFGHVSDMFLFEIPLGIFQRAAF